MSKFHDFSNTANSSNPKICDEFKVHILNEQGIEVVKKIADLYNQLLIDIMDRVTPSRELSIVKTKLEEACFFSKKAAASMVAYQKREE